MPLYYSAGNCSWSLAVAVLTLFVVAFSSDPEPTWPAVAGQFGPVLAPVSFEAGHSVVALERVAHGAAVD